MSSDKIIQQPIGQIDCECNFFLLIFKLLCRKYKIKYDFSNSKFVRIHIRDNFVFSNGYTSLADKRCTRRKFFKPCYQAVLRKTLYRTDAMKTHLS